MPLNAATISAVRSELSEKLANGKIEKIQQPEHDLLLLTVRAEGENRKTLIRAGGPNTRIHLTERSFENPSEAPMFCMLLRKYLTGARIRGILQPGGDRLLIFQIESRNELGDSAQLQLVVELMGRAANVILVESEGRILDCLRRHSPSESGGRALLPGLKYTLPERPQQFREQTEQSESIPENISEVLDRRYGQQEETELQRRRSQELVRSVRRIRDRQQRKLALQKEELRRTGEMENVRRQAELLQANLWQVKKGDAFLNCEDYYQEGNPMVRILLDPQKSPQQNLEKRFKEYRKLRGAREHLTALTEDGEKQLDYLNSVLEELERAETAQDLLEIRMELERGNWLKSQKKKAKKGPAPSAPLRFRSDDGFEILVGRNNAQNDELTTKTARRTDWWLHVKDLHGSHVILRCEGQQPTEQALEQAGRIAAYYSQARDAGRTAVDYTMVKNVKKPSGALPGKVIYRDYQTMLVTAENRDLTDG